MLAFALPGCNRRVDPNAPVELRFWYAWSGYEGKFLQSLVDEFNATHPHIHVQGSFYNIGDKLLASIAGGSPPDIVTVWEFMLTTMGESGAFFPLEDYVTSAGLTRDSYLPNLYDYGTYGKHRWGVPSAMNALAIFYNTKLVRDAGLDPAQYPKTMAELAEWAKKLTLYDERGIMRQLGFSPSATPVYFWNFGGNYFDTENKRFTLDDPGCIRAMEWMASVHKSSGIVNVRRFSAGFGKLDSPLHPLAQGKMALREDGQWLIKILAEYAPDLDYGVFPFPPEKAGDTAVTRVDSSFWAIPYASKHPDEAWEFLSWLIAPEQSARFCFALRNIPPLHASVNHPAFAEARKDPRFDFFVREVEEGRARTQPAMPVGQQFQEKLEQGQDVVWGGSITPKAFLENLNMDMNRQLDRETRMLGSGDDL
jgi:ABC-type glycerol-3-phosphate transport system substrate-binding protein